MNRGDVPIYVNWDESGNPVLLTNQESEVVRHRAAKGWITFKLDSAGNERAIDLGLNRKKFAYLVKVEGVTRRRDGMVSRSAITVQAIAVLRRVNRHGKDAPGLCGFPHEQVTQRSLCDYLLGSDQR